MSCRVALNMAKRAAAGAVSVPAALSEEETDSSSHATDFTPISQRNSQRGSGATGLGRVTAIAFSVFAVLSFASYAAYAHQWSELSALRHLGSIAGK